MKFGKIHVLIEYILYILIYWYKVLYNIYSLILTLFSYSPFQSMSGKYILKSTPFSPKVPRCSFQ